MIVRPARSSEYDEIIDLVEQAFPPGDGAAVITAAAGNDPRFRADHMRVVEREGRIVGMVNVIDRMVHIGAAQVRCAIIAPLATAREHQGTGVGSALMRDILEWARANNFQLSMLWGHTWLYPRYGYAPGIKSYSVVLDAKNMPLGDTAYTLRPYSSADVSAVLRVYEAETATAMLAEVRAPEPWAWRPHNPATVVDVAVDPARTIRGYFRAVPEAERINVGELMALDAGAVQALYDRLLYLAREHEASEISVTATPDSRWARFAFAQGAQLRIGSGGGAGMVRVLDLPAFLREIQPELERRVGMSEFVCQRADVRLESPVGRATIIVDNGRVAVTDDRVANNVTLPFHALGPLIAGYRPIGELVGLPGVFMYGGEQQRLLDVLFPERYPHWSFAAYFT